MRFREIREARDYEDEWMPDDERWLRKYLHQGLDRWPSENVIASLKEKQSNSVAMLIYRGMNFRDQDDFDEFMQNFDGTCRQSVGISSWSPDRQTATGFAYVRKTYFPDAEHFRQEKLARDSGEKLRGYRGVVLKLMAPAHSLILFSGGYESEVLLTQGVYPNCEIEIIKPYREQIQDGFDINSYILGLTTERQADEMENYIRQNHITDLSQKSRDHLFQLDGGSELGTAKWEAKEIHFRVSSQSLYDTEVRFWFNSHTFTNAVEGMYGPRPELEKAARKVFNTFKNVESAHPDAKLYVGSLKSDIELAGAEIEMKAILKRRIGEKYHELNKKFVGPVRDDPEWPRGQLRTAQEQMKELLSQYEMLTG